MGGIQVLDIHYSGDDSTLTYLLLNGFQHLFVLCAHADALQPELLQRD